MASQLTIDGPGESQACTVNDSLPFHTCGSAIAATTPTVVFNGLFWFDVAGDMPANRTIDSAYLKLPQNGFTDSPCDADLTVAEQQDDWFSAAGSSYPTWDSPDGTITGWDGGASGLGSFSTTIDSCLDDDTQWSAHTAVFDVTSPVQSIYSGDTPSTSFEVFAGSGKSGQWGTTFSDPPQLVINFHR